MNFNIVTYVSAGFASCLDLTLKSWVENSGAQEIYIYTDVEAGSGWPIGFDGHNVHTVFKYHERGDNGPAAWMRKIEVIQDALPNSHLLVYLDADVYCTGNLSEAFNTLSLGADIGATRMFNPTRRGHGSINAGVLFFVYDDASLKFVAEWQQLAEELRPQGGWFEQEAASRLLHESFDGLKDYYCTPLSENVWNCEDDNDQKWLERIEKYRPKLIHFKSGKWKNRELVDKILFSLALEYHSVPAGASPNLKLYSWPINYNAV